MRARCALPRLGVPILKPKQQLRVAGTNVTFTGSGFGTSQGSGSVWLGSTNGQVISWSDTQVIADVAPGAVTGIARVQQNGVGSNALGFTVPANGPGGTTMTVEPAMINMVVGDTHTIQAFSSTGQAVTGLAWTSSDPTVVSLSTDNPPVLTALAAGHVTVTAGTASADVTVSADALPLGTVIWSNPGNGSGVSNIVPAVPSPSGVADVFAFQNDGTVQAITADGTTAWTADVSQAEYTVNGQLAVPDFQGGLVSCQPGSFPDYSIVKYDGMTGQAHTIYEDELWRSCSLAVHPDGTIFMARADGVHGIDPIAGQKFVVPYQPQGGGPNGTVIVAGDGYFYVPYITEEVENNTVTTRFRLLRVNSAGVSDDIVIETYRTPCCWDGGIKLWANMITNADQGVIIIWSSNAIDSNVPKQLRMAITSGTTVTVMDGPQAGEYTNVTAPVLQAQDGSFIGITGIPSDWDYAMVAFDQSGKIRWVVPNETPSIATADGGVIGTSGITYDSNGNATGQLGRLPIYSWKGAYQIGSVESIVSDWWHSVKSFWSAVGGI